MTKTEVREVQRESIHIGERYRKDYGDLSELALSVREKGILQPVTLDQDLNLLAGGRRMRVAELLALDVVPALIRETHGEADALEVELVENIHRKDLTWQERAALEARIYELKGSQRATADVVGSAVGSVNRHVQLANAMKVLPEIAKFKTEDEAWKAVKKMEESILIKELVSRQEEKHKDAPRHKATPWDFAKNQYQIGNAIEGLGRLQPGVWHFAEVDPPYGVKLDTLKRRDGEGAQGLKSYENYSEIDIDVYPDFLASVSTELYRVLADNCFCVWWFGPTHFELVKNTLRAAGFAVQDVPGIWYKGNQGQTNQPNTNLANCYEMFFIARKGQPTLHKQGRSNVFHFDPIPGSRKTHPTERPIELMMEILDTFLWPSQQVISPFLGSGVTLRAAYRMGTYGMGWDLSEEHKNRFLLSVEEDVNFGRIGRGEGSKKSTAGASIDGEAD